MEPLQIQYVYWIDDERDPEDYLSEGGVQGHPVAQGLRQFQVCAV